MTCESVDRWKDGMYVESVGEIFSASMVDR